MTTARRPRRPLFVIAAVGAALVTAIFATVGDGVEATSADPLPGFVIDHFHTLAWVLLAVAFGLAAFLGRWTRPSGWIALGSLASYAAFVATLLTTD